MKQWSRTLLASLRRTLGTSARAFLRAGGPTQAAALAFYALLSAIPLCFLMLELYGLVMGDAWTAQLMLRRQLAAAAPFFDDQLVSRARRLFWSSPAMTWQSLAFILWSSWLFVGGLRQALRLPWRDQPASPASWRVWGVRCVRAPLVGVLFFVALAGVLFCANLPRLEPAGSFMRRMAPIWGLLCLSGLFGVLYLLFLPRRRPLVPICLVSMVLAVAAYGVSALFVTLVASLPRYHMVYGSLSGAVLFLLWLDYHVLIILWGAWFLRHWQREHPVAGGSSHRRFVLSGWLGRVRPWRGAGT